MTDDRVRSAAETDRGVVIEVPLIGDAAVSSMDPATDDDRPRHDWRRAIGITLVGGLLGGIVLSVVLLRGVDESEGDDDTATTLAPDELSSRITTPPTLEPLAPLPLPDDPVPNPVDDRPQPTSQDRTLFDDGPAVPSYQAVPGADQTVLSEYDLDAAVGALGLDVPRRSHTHLELGTAGFILDVTIVRDPERDRYHVTIESRGQTQTAIVDNATGTTYVDVGTDNRVEVPNEEIFADSDATTVNEYFNRLLLGPLRPDTIGDATTQGRDLVMIDDVGLARRFLATIPGSRVPEWQLYAFSPVFEFRVEDRPSQLEYSVYVDEAGNVAQVDGVARVGAVPQLVQHRIERLDPPEPIDLAIGTASTSPTITTTQPNESTPVTTAAG